MTAAVSSTAMRPRPRGPAPAIVATGALIGALDLLFAWGFWLGKGVTLQRILQSIGSGWFGKRSFDMGATSATIGIFSHFGIAIAFVLAYWLVARRTPTLLRHPIAYGLPYGVCLYLLMNLVVLPLSAAGSPGFDNLPWVASSVVMHAAIGVICAYGARLAARRH